jgi:hypothetical protein
MTDQEFYADIAAKILERNGYEAMTPMRVALRSQGPTIDFAGKYKGLPVKEKTTYCVSIEFDEIACFPSKSRQEKT